MNGGACAICLTDAHRCELRHNGEVVCYGMPTPHGFQFIREQMTGGRVYAPAADSIPAPIERDHPGIEFPPEWTPVGLADLAGGGDVPWLWHGYIACGFATLLIGLFKAGKSTLLAHLLKAMGDGGELAGSVSAGRALVISEEGAALWARRRDDLAIGGQVEIICRPFKTRPYWADWENFAAHVAGLVEQNDYKLVVFDTLSGFLPVKSENEASEVLRALLPLHGITEVGAALLLIHHPRKSGGDDGTASRGSGALPGWVDTIVELRRFAPKDREDRRRTLLGLSRFDETPVETVIELGEDGYKTVGSKSDARHDDRAEVIRDMLPSDPPGWTVGEIRDGWPENGVPKPGVRTAQNDLGKMDGIRRTGAGTKGDPFRFSNSIPASPVSIGAGIQSGDNSDGDG